MRRPFRSLQFFFLLAVAEAFLAEQPSPILRIPGSPDRPITAASLLARGRSDVRLESAEGDVRIFHGMPLLDVLEKNGLETRTMAARRKIAPAVLLITARDGYTVVFSVGELLMQRADPRVYLVSETAAGPLPEDEGPVRLIVPGDHAARSARGVAKVELQYLAQNSSIRALPNPP